MKSNSKIIDKNEMLSWIENFTKLPHRRTGTKEGRESAEYVKDTFNSFGLSNVEIIKSPSICHETKKCSLTVDKKEYYCFPANGTNRKEETGYFNTDIRDAEIIYLGKGLEEDFDGIDVRGKIVVCDVYFIQHSHKTTEGVIPYDPNGQLERPRNIYNIYAPNNWPYNYIFAMKNGAAGFVGILHNFMDANYYHEDYTYIVEMDDYMKIPAVWISLEDGRRLTDYLNTGVTVKSNMCVETIYEYKEALNVKGCLHGSSDDYIVIHSHHDATGTGAVQDASGMSVVFALAKYYASLPEEEIKTSLMFLATDSHYTDYEGHDKFLDKCQEEGLNIIMDLAVEHIAKTMDLDKENKMIISDEPETRIIYVTDISGMLQTVLDAVKKNNIVHTLIHPVKSIIDTGFIADEVCTDAYCFHERGIPVVSMLSAPMYLFHNSDSIDKIHKESLEPVTMFYVDMVEKVWEDQKSKK